jgi:hypothetical protein
VTPIALFIGFLVLWAVARRFASAQGSVAGILAGLLVATLVTWSVAPGLLVPKPDVPSGTPVG